MAFDPSNEIRKMWVFGEFGGVNPSITDSSTYTYMNPETMEKMFDEGIEGCFLYTRHSSPSNTYLSNALAKLEGSEAAIVMSSGMAAISNTIFQICSSGDEIVSSPKIYGGTYTFFKNFLPKFGIKVHFVDINDQDEVKKALSNKTKIIYCESISNPLAEISDIASLGKIANEFKVKLVVDNTFSPMIVSPLRFGAHIVIHSLTKFINGTSDCVAGCICADSKFIGQLVNVNDGASMLLGPVLDSFRSSSILKNLNTLHVRIQKHSLNAQYLAQHFENKGFKVFYPGLPSHKQHEFIKKMVNPGFGFGGVLAIDVGSADDAKRLMVKMQENKVGYLAVSLGYFKTLFCAPGHSTSSEIPEEKQKEMGLSKGLVRISVGLDNDMAKTCVLIDKSLKDAGLI